MQPPASEQVSIPKPAADQKPPASSLAPPFQLQMFSKPQQQHDPKKDAEMKKKWALTI